MWTRLITAIKELINGKAIEIPKAPVKIMTVDIKVIPAKQVEEKLSSDKNLIFLPDVNGPGKLQNYTDQNKTAVFEYVLYRLTTAISSGLNEVSLFECGRDRKIVKLSKSNYEPYLNRMLSHFVEIEAYENASKCRDLIRLINT